MCMCMLTFVNSKYELQAYYLFKFIELMVFLLLLLAFVIVENDKRMWNTCSNNGNNNNIISLARHTN